MQKVDILLATYNGSKYLDAQMRSLLSQTFTSWRLLVHDDNSKDETVDIVRRYAAVDKRIILLNDGLYFGNAAANFLHLLKFAKADLIMFCDQDDIWFENKIANLVEIIKDEACPCAVYCNAYGYNGDVITFSKSTQFIVSCLRNTLFLNGGIQGCSLMLNQALLRKLDSRPNFVFMHDHFITIAAVTFGKIKYVNKSLMLYRQHSNNVTGNVITGKYNRIRSFFRRNAFVIDKLHYDANFSFYNKYKDCIEPKSQQLFLQYFKYAESTLLKRLFIVIKNKFSMGNNALILILKTLIRRPINA